MEGMRELCERFVVVRVCCRGRRGMEGMKRKEEVGIVDIGVG